MEILTDIANKIGFDWKLSISHLINLLIIFFLLVKYALPAIKKTVEERNRKIEEGLRMRTDADIILDDAKKASQEIVKSANVKAQDVFLKAENNSKEIISNANEKANEIILSASREKEDAKEKGLRDAENILLKDMPNILAKVSANAFSQKINPDINKDFISKVFKI